MNTQEDVDVQLCNKSYFIRRINGGSVKRPIEVGNATLKIIYILDISLWLAYDPPKTWTTVTLIELFLSMEVLYHQ